MKLKKSGTRLYKSLIYFGKKPEFLSKSNGKQRRDVSRGKTQSSYGFDSCVS